MNISHNGLGELVTTFETSNDTLISAGTLIKLVDGRAAVAGVGDDFIGVAADDSRNKKLAVQVGGYVKLNYTGTPAYGNTYVKVKNATSVEFCASSAQNAVPVKVIFVNSAKAVAGFIM